MAQLARDTWLDRAPYNDADYLSYTDVLQHPGNGAAFEIDALTGAETILEAQRFSVARTRRGYVTPTPASGVYSLTPGMRQAYGGLTGTTPDIDRGPYTF